MTEFTVGQELYYVPDKYGNPRSVTITKVGRLWLEIGSGYPRIKKDTMAVDGRGYSPPGSVYLSKADHDMKMTLSSAWSKFTRAVRPVYQAPVGTTVENIEKAQELLGLARAA